MNKLIYFLLLLLGLNVSAQEASPLWLEYQRARVSGDTPELPDFSYAGYHFSEREIPNVTTEVFDVTSFGAIPNDDKYDDEAIRAAIAAAHQANGGIVFFPSGRFLISPDEDKEQFFSISKSNIILRGSGSGSDGTEIFMDKMRIGSRQFRFSPEDQSTEKLTEIVGEAPRETFWVNVADASRLSEGQDVVINHRSEAYTRDYFTPLELNPKWERLFGPKGGMQVREIHTIERIEGNRVRFKNPIHLNIKEIEGYPFELHTYPSIEECGIEGIRFVSNWKNYPEEFVHHKNGIHDGGWAAISMNYVKNSWIRVCVFDSWNETVSIGRGYQVSVLNVSVEGKKGHSSIFARSGNGVLIKNCDFSGASHHGPATGYGGVGTVVTHCTLGEDQIIDSHSGQPYVTLFDDIEGGVFYNLGGPHPGFPHHGRYMVFWNFQYRSDHAHHYNFWNLDQRKNYTISFPIFVGFRANQEITFEQEGINQLPGVEVGPKSLFEAQLELRLSAQKAEPWQSGFVQVSEDGELTYAPDEQGNVIPDFSRVGYHQGDKVIPDVPVKKTISPAESGSSQEIIQNAIDELAKLDPDENGFRGAILLKKGTYNIPGTVYVRWGGIVLRGEGDGDDGTRLLATGTDKRSLLVVQGEGSIQEIAGSRKTIAEDYVPVGAKSFLLKSTKKLKEGDPIILYRPGTDNWITDLKMNQIVERKGTRQWKGADYDLSFERKITGIAGNRIFIDNPVVMPMETKYGGGEIYKYSFEGRIAEVGVENISFETEYVSDTAENHGWVAVYMNKVENGWVRNITSKHFGYACVSLGLQAKQITVQDSRYLDPKSIITGGRRYSFNNEGQLNLFMNLHSEEGRHDYVTGARSPGPNVFFNCTARNSHADIGPHQRWAVGTLYDNIVTDGAINVQDRGYMGSGHGWSGVTQVIWHCTAEKAAIQSPWVTGKNYCIGLKGEKYAGWKTDRSDGEWEGNNQPGLIPQSLYKAQLEAQKTNSILE